ncbi:MAG: hypothetical protein LBF59_01120 [Prevotellaceae bacterium]|nr:hypothetical protein [Prevotellaceae bacterium]
MKYIDVKMRSEALKDFIREHAVLFWYSPDDKAETVSDELLVETILLFNRYSIVMHNERCSRSH